MSPFCRAEEVGTQRTQRITEGAEKGGPIFSLSIPSLCPPCSLCALRVPAFQSEFAHPRLFYRSISPTAGRVHPHHGDRPLLSRRDPVQPDGRWRARDDGDPDHDPHYDHHDWH